MKMTMKQSARAAFGSSIVRRLRCSQEVVARWSAAAARSRVLTSIIADGAGQRMIRLSRRNLGTKSSFPKFEIISSSLGSL